MKVIQNWKVFVLLVCVIAAAAAIFLKPSGFGSGVEITYIDPNSTARGVLSQGDIVTEVNGVKVSTVDDWDKATKNLNGLVSVKVNNRARTFTVNDTLGINVINLASTNLDFGLDLRGGTRVLLKAKEKSTPETIEEAKATLQNRANLFGLSEIKFKLLADISGDNLIQIEASGIGSNVISDLLAKTGKFEAKISKPVDLSSDKKGEIQLLSNKYPVELVGNATIKVGDKTIALNETFELENINFKFLGVKDTTLMLLGDVYTGKDIELVYTDPQRSGIAPAASGYTFYFGVLVSGGGAEKFAKVTSGIPKYLDLSGGGDYLKDSEIFLYLDDELITNLRISAELGGVPYTSPQITGGRDTKEEAIQEKLQLQTILRSGATPVGLEIVSVDVISPTLGGGFIKSAGYVAILAGVIVFIIVFARYRKLKIALPMIFISFSEILLILGIAAINDSLIWGLVLLINLIFVVFAWSKKHELDIFGVVGALTVPILGASLSWTIDLPAIGGIIAALGTSVDHQIIIADESLSGVKKMLMSLKDRIKVAFFIIGGAAATTIFAMIPLIFLVAEFVRGFALTTIVGVWVGVSLTRPTYGKIIEILNKDKEPI